MSSLEFAYRPGLEWVGDKTVYVYVNGTRIGWIAARQEYEFGKINFCYKPNQKGIPKRGNTMIFGEVSRMEEWIRENHKVKPKKQS